MTSLLLFLDDAAEALEEFFGDIPTHAFVVVVRDDIPCVGSRPGPDESAARVTPKARQPIVILDVLEDKFRHNF